MFNNAVLFLSVDWMQRNFKHLTAVQEQNFYYDSFFYKIKEERKTLPSIPSTDVIQGEYDQWWHVSSASVKKRRETEQYREHTLNTETRIGIDCAFF